MTGLKISGLSFAFGEREVLRQVSFELGAGQFCALLGPNGAGKSTLFGLLTRLFVAEQGEIEIGGKSLAREPRQALTGMGVVFQQSTLDLDLTVEQNLRYFAALHGISGRLAEERIIIVLTRMEMLERRHERARNLNGGHRRRVEIARSLLHEPEVLLLDEPTSGLDAASRTALTAHVHDLCARHGITVLWATHLTDEIEEDDRLIILHQGRILADGIASEFGGKQGLQQAFLSLTRDVA